MRLLLVDGWSGRDGYQVVVDCRRRREDKCLASALREEEEEEEVEETKDSSSCRWSGSGTSCVDPWQE